MSILTTPTALAQTETNQWFPQTGRALASGAAVSDVKTIGGDGMLPVFGNSNGFAFADFMGDYGSDNTYLVSPGLGYRKVFNNQIWGGYFFGDYERTSLGENFWVMSPGVEWMNNHWDGHVNGYFPTETTKQTSNAEFLSDTGNYSQVSFEEGTHNQYDELLAPYAIIGNGVDAEIGYSFSGLSNLRTRVYAGGYYYAPPKDSIDATGYGNVDNITGVTAGFQQPISKNFKVSVFNSYDNVNNYVAGVALIVMLGQDSAVFSNNIHDRLLDPVERHVGIVDTGAGTYDQQEYESLGTALQYDNVYFISETTEGLGDGTYGNSMMLTQTTLDTIDSETSSSRIYLQGNSTYYVDKNTANSVTMAIPAPLGLYVYDGQGIYGRSADFKSPGTGSEKPVILVDTQNSFNGFVVTEEGENTFENLTITAENDSDLLYDMSLSMDTAGILVINDSMVKNTTININNTQISGFIYGAMVYNDGNSEFTLNINDSMLNDNKVYGLGIINQNTGTMSVNIDNSTFNNNGSLTEDDLSIEYADGLYAENNDTGILTISATDSEFNNNGNISGNNDLMNATSGLYAKNNNTGVLTVTAKNSSFDNNGLITGDNALIDMNVTGITLENSGSGTATLNVKDSTFNNNGLIMGSGTINGDVTGGYLQNESSGTLTMSANGSQFNNNVDMGLLVFNSSSGTINVSSLSGATFNGNGYGIYASSEGGATTIDYTGAIFANNTYNSNYMIGDDINWIPNVAP